MLSFDGRSPTQVVTRLSTPQAREPEGRKVMRKRNVYSMIVATALIAVMAGTARASDEFNRRGPYIGFGPSGALTNFDGAFSGFGNSYGFNARGGYRFNDYIAIEGLYEYMDDFGSSETSSNGRVKTSASIQTSNFTTSVKLIFPTLGLSQLQPFVSGGIGFLNANGSGKIKVDGSERVDRSPSSTEFAGRVDGGVDYFFTPELSTFFDVGYVIPAGDLSDMNYLSLGAGIKYNF
jgi:hypothetical protein